MLRTLTRLLRRRSADPSQLALDFDHRPDSAEALLERLRLLGLKRITRCRLTRNRNVMVSFGGGELRVHEGYLGAPTTIHQAIVDFVEGRTRAERQTAQRAILSFPIRTRRPPARRERTRPDDEWIVEELVAWFRRYNLRHFGGKLREVPIRVSRRMKSRLGHYTAATPNGEPAEIAISHAHLKRHGWDEVKHTLLHEMVHQWQDEVGHPIDHGATFRRKAREVGVAPFARRALASRSGRGVESKTVGRRAARQE